MRRMSCRDGKAYAGRAKDWTDLLMGRYFAMLALDHIQRSKALAEWDCMLMGKELPLERAQGAFDLFVLHDNRGDLDEV